MPSQATVQAATPKCPYPSLGTEVGRVKGEPCGKPLKYVAGPDAWKCPRHGQVITSQSLVAGQAA